MDDKTTEQKQVQVMSGDDISCRIPRFDGKNFGLWKRQVKVVLRAKGLLATLDKNEPSGFTEGQDNKTQAILFSAMEQSVIQKVLSCETSGEIWERLHQVYENTSPANVGKIFEQYYSYKKLDSDDMATHISKVESLAIQLEQVNEKQSEISIMSKLIHSLPASYDSLKEAWDSVHPTLQSRSNLIARMLAHDATTSAEPAKDVALVARTNKSRFNGQSNEDKKKKAKCYNCGKIGHYKRECKSKPKDGEEKSQTKQESGIALVVSPGKGSDKWIVDSGASQHTCGRRDWFSTFGESNERLQVGNDQWVQSKGQGTIKIVCRVGKRDREVELQNVLYIPEMSYNLFSTSKAAEKGAITVLNQKGCKVIVDGSLVAVGEKDPDTGLCVLKGTTVTGILMLVSTRRTLEDWHRSLGHVDQQVIAQMIKDKCVEGMELEKSIPGGCSECPAGKGIRASHTTGTSVSPTAVGDQIDLDLVGPINVESLGKSRYIMLARDTYSSYSHVFMLKSKDETCSALQRYIGEFEAQSGKRIKSILTDNGSEFNNTAVKTLMAVEHISLRFSSPYTPEQNGGAERNNRTIVSTARTMLLESKLPLELWGEAVSTAVYIRNRVARRNRSVTPYEQFTGRKPFVGHMVPFGTPVQSMINDRRRGKFDPRTEPAFITGFTTRSNTYRIYLPEGNKVKESCDVIFRGHGNLLKNGTNEIYTELEVTEPETRKASDQRPIDTFFDELDRNRPGGEPEEISQQPTNKDPKPGCSRAEDSDYDPESPSFSTITNLSTRDTEPQQEGDSADRVQDPAAHNLQAASPFRGNTIPRTPMPTRGPSLLLARGSTEPKVAGEPTSYEEAVEGPNRESWKLAVASELTAHARNKTWSVVKRPASGTLLSAKWIFKLKRDSRGNIEKFKARLVARGFQQVQGVNYGETFAPVARIESVRTLLAVAAARNYAVERFDVSTAFLYGQVDEDIYLEPPEGVQIAKNECLKLNKALYGLKQAPRIWNSHFDRSIKALGFKPIRTDPCVYLSQSVNCYLAVYVDDGVLVGPSESTCLAVIRGLNESFETNRITSDVFLGMQITRSASSITLNQRRYVKDMLETFNMESCSPVSSPLADTKELFEHADEEDVQAPYRAAIGSLLYVAVATRPDILFATTLLARFCEHPKRVHWAAVKRVMRYLKGTDYSLTYKQQAYPLSIDAYSDADWAGDVQTRRSTTGVLISTGGGSAIIFASRQQNAVALSSTEAEFVAACEASKELTWLLMFLTELGVEYSQPTLHIDNRSAIALIKNHDVKRRSKHIDIKYHLVRQKYREGLFALEHVETDNQAADLLTKALSGEKLKALLGAKSNASGDDRGGVLG